MNVGIGLYVKNSHEAVELYIKSFGLELGYHVLNKDGSYYHSELVHDGHEVLSVVEAGDDNNTDGVVQVGITLDSEDDVRNAYKLLSDGGNIDMPIGPLPWSPCAASLTDKFGVWWYITVPQHRPADDWEPEK